MVVARTKKTIEKIDKIKNNDVVALKHDAVINGHCNITKCANPFVIVGGFVGGEHVAILERENGFTKITTNEITGYVPDYYITLLKV